MEEKIIKDMEQLLLTQHYGVFNTVRDDLAHSTLVCFAPSPDWSHFVFFTREQTRKAINMKIHRRVSLFVDNRKNEPEDIENAMTVTVYGTQVEVDASTKELYKDYFLQKNPHMEFFLKPSVQMEVIKVDTYEVVTNFQSIVQAKPSASKFSIEVRQLQGQKWNEGVFRGKLVSVDTDVSDWSKAVVWVKNELPKTEVGAIVVTGSVTKEALKDYSCPIVYLKEEESLEIGHHVTVDGYLGIVIHHRVK